MALPLPSSAKPLLEVRFLGSGIWDPGLNNQFRTHFHENAGYALHYSAESQLIYVEKRGAHRAVHVSRSEFFTFKIAADDKVVPMKAVK